MREVENRASVTCRQYMELATLCGELSAAIDMAKKAIGTTMQRTTRTGNTAVDGSPDTTVHPVSTR